VSDSSALKRAKELFESGSLEEAEQIIAGLLKENPRDVTVLNFRAYLLYRRGRVEDAIAAYRRLADLDPRTVSHLANLGTICFKAQRYPEAQTAFERQLELQPGDPKVLRNLGFCHERLGTIERALDCFTRAGDEENAEKIRERLVPAEKPVRGAAPGEGERQPGGGAPPGSAGAARRQDAAAEPEVGAWLEGICLARPGEGPELARAGAGELVLQIREKVTLNPVFCAGHRGVVMFAPSFREAGKAAAKFGDKRGVLARAEGNGELVLSGCGRGLHAIHLGGGRLFVNYAALVLCGTEIEVAFDYGAVVKGAFLAAELTGTGPVILAVRGAPVVLPVPSDLPTVVRPEAVVAWTENLRWAVEVVPELKKLVGKEEATRYRFEGRGYLVLQGL
jgi:uncharacterized protein (AIM24 family)